MADAAQTEAAGAGVDRVLAALHTLGQALARGDGGAWMESDLTMAQVRALFTIFRHGPLPVSGVAQHLSVGLPTASHLVDCLVRAGLVERRGDADDRRVVHCSATPAGAALLSEATAARSERLRALVERLDGTTRQGLLRGLERLAELAGDDARAQAGKEEERKHARA